MTFQRKKILKSMLAFSLCTLTMSAFALSQNLGQISAQIYGNLSNLSKLITAGSYVAGLGFSIGAIMKFKAHKDNPTQVPVGTPAALVFIAASLLFLPSILGTTGATIFSDGGTVATSTGTAWNPADLTGDPADLTGDPADLQG